MFKSIYSLRYIKTSKTAALRKIRDMLFFSFVKAVVVVTLIAILVAKNTTGASIQTTHPTVEQALTAVGVTGDIRGDIARAVVMAERYTGIDAFLLIALAVTESSLNPLSKSTKGYYGIMQVPIKTASIESNVITGAAILNKKIKIAGGDIKKAIALYKGYGVTRKGLEKAEAVLALYETVKTIKNKN